MGRKALPAIKGREDSLEAHASVGVAERRLP
jgi:hypothetical protein